MALNLKRTPASMRQLIRSDRNLFSGSDDNAMIKQIQATHSPDGYEIDVKPVLYIVKDLFSYASPNGIAASGTQAYTEERKTFDQATSIATLEALAFVIERIANEIAYNGHTGGDAHATTMSIFNMLSNYSWDAKVVIALAAFALNYGEFWLLAQSYTSNQLAKSVAILKQLPEILEHSGSLKSRFDAIKNLIRVMLDIAECIIQFKELPVQYMGSDATALTTATSHIPITVYWTIRCTVACASQINSLIGLRHEQIALTAESWETSSLVHKLENMHSHLAAQLAICYKQIDEKKFLESYQNLIHLFEMTHIDNMKILKALIYAKDDQLPLVDGVTKRRVSIEVLWRKNVLLLISDLDIPQEELAILEQIYNESRQHPTRNESQYEVVWLPIIEPGTPWTENKKKRFEELQLSMPWYTVHSPSFIDKAVIKFTKEVWHFEKKPILVVLDPVGRVVCPNALHMMWIWGSLAFPFTTLREEALWKDANWKLDLLVDGIDPSINTWITQGSFVCLYGGEDIEWIRKLTTTASAVAKAANIPLEMVYVGKSNPKERVRRNIATITAENLSRTWQELTSIWLFWVRIESMWYSKHQLGRTIENDQIMREIKIMLTFDSSESGWAIMSKGQDDMVKAKGDTFFTCLADYTLWKENIQNRGFLQALRDRISEYKVRNPHHCNKFKLPGFTGMIPETVTCAECGRVMDKYILYQCCDD